MIVKETEVKGNFFLLYFKTFIKYLVRISYTHSVSRLLGCFPYNTFFFFFLTATFFVLFPFFSRSAEEMYFFFFNSL